MYKRQVERFADARMKTGVGHSVMELVGSGYTTWCYVPHFVTAVRVFLAFQRDGEPVDITPYIRAIPSIDLYTLDAALSGGTRH